MLRLYYTLLALATLLLAWPDVAGAQPNLVSARPGGNAISQMLIPETPGVQPGGTVTLALVMTPKPGWHGYWINPGDAGAGMKIEWALPAGVAAESPRYPVPQRLTIAGLMNYVYEQQYTLLINLKVNAKAASGTILPIRARLNYLACTDQICVPERSRIEASLTVGDIKGGNGNAAIFERARQKLPHSLDAPGRFESSKGRLRLAVPLPASFVLADPDPYFYPLTENVIVHAAPQTISRNGDWLIIDTEAGREASRLSAVEGVLQTHSGEGFLLRATRGVVPANGVLIRPDADKQSGGAQLGTILAALAGALIGGLLLNIMPCIFPILSLKALSLARAGETEGAARREALAYTAGVLTVCLALGATLLSLRAGGASIGWAFQLQNPYVTLLLLLLVTGIALNLTGLFEFPVLAARGKWVSAHGVNGAFWTGALAAFIATPCTGPFMGAALGAALILPPLAAMAVFAGLGIGFALPFLLLGFLPALRNKLPRPGAWMERLKHILAVPMFITALGLAWLLGRQTGVDGITIGLGTALILALSLWWVGQRQGKKPHAWLPLILAGAGAAAALSFIPQTDTPVAATVKNANRTAEPFSEARLAALRQEGRPVFVYFTADWCLTCKVNEKAVLERAEVQQSFATHKVAVLEGDWTRGDAAIGRFLARYERSGVPLYLYYAPGREAQILPQLLTIGTVTRTVGDQG